MRKVFWKTAIRNYQMFTKYPPEGISNRFRTHYTNRPIKKWTLATLISAATLELSMQDVTSQIQL